MINKQPKQHEWKWQWSRYYDEDPWLFEEWIYPNKLEDFKGKDAIDCGCGAGTQLNFIAPYCRYALGIDLNTSEIAKRNISKNKNIEVIEGDIATFKSKKKFDIVYSIGVLHHTNNPASSFNNIKKLAKKGGRVIVWVYSYEGNFLNRVFLEPLKKILLSRLNKNVLRMASVGATLFLYIPIYTVYLLPIRFLPFYEYFQNFRRLKFKMNNLNIFDKLNAPTTYFIRKGSIESWFNNKDFFDVHISHYKGVSWRASGTVKNRVFEHARNFYKFESMIKISDTSRYSILMLWSARGSLLRFSLKKHAINMLVFIFVIMLFQGCFMCEA